MSVKTYPGRPNALTELLEAHPVLWVGFLVLWGHMGVLELLLSSHGRLNLVEKVVRIFNSHKEADVADREFYRSLTPTQRVLIAIQIHNDYYGTEKRLERLVRVSKRERS